MRRLFILAVSAAAWAAVPSAVTVTAAGSLATVSLLTAGEARAGTALLPGWKLSCGRNPRCFEHGEYRRQVARLRTLSGPSRPINPARSQTNAPAPS